jgi:hypothetical protein
VIEASLDNEKLLGPILVGERSATFGKEWLSNLRSVFTLDRPPEFPLLVQLIKPEEQKEAIWHLI